MTWVLPLFAQQFVSWRRLECVAKVWNKSQASLFLIFIGEESTKMTVPWAQIQSNFLCITINIDRTPNDACRWKYCARLFFGPACFSSPLRGYCSRFFFLKSKESKPVLINSFIYHLGQWHFVCGPQAWSSIVYQLIPNVKQLEANLTQFGDIIDADEVLLFERATFLVSICYLSGVWHNGDSDNEVCFH